MRPKLIQPDKQSLAQAAKALQSGKLIGLPTETVYGLAADATNDKAVAAIYAAKGRPEFNPLIVHFLDIAHAEQQVVFTPPALKLAQKFWPGALTLVLARREDSTLSLLVSAGLDTVAVRVPAHAIAVDLLKESGLPLAAPSANKSGRVSPTMAQHVIDELEEEVELVINGGDCKIGLESTVVDCSGSAVVLLRHGGIPKEQIEEILGEPMTVATHHAEKGPKSPGMLLQHYAPSLPVRLNAKQQQAGEALIAFGEGASDNEDSFNLSRRGDLVEAASRLFAAMRHFDDAKKYKAIAVMPIPNEGLGAAINDRLKRAAER